MCQPFPRWATFSPAPLQGNVDATCYTRVFALMRTCAGVRPEDVSQKVVLMRAGMAWIVFSLALWGAWGCGRQVSVSEHDAAASGQAGTGDNAGSSDSKDRGPGLRLRHQVASYPGKWAFIIPEALPDRSGNMTYREICLALLEFEHQPETGLVGKVLATVEPERLKWEFQRLEVDGPQIAFELRGTSQVDFRGTLQESLVRGTVMSPTSPEEGVKPALLKPTEEESFKGWDPFPFAPGIDIFSQAIQDKEQPEAMLRAAKELRGNALSLVAYQGLLGRLHQFPQLNESLLREIMEGYADSAALWGSRMEWQARMNSAAGVTSLRRYPKLAQELVQRVTQSPSDYLKVWDDVLTNMTHQVQIDLALEKMRSSDGAERAQGFRELQEQLQHQRYNPEILATLGQYAHEQGQLDLAQQYLAEIVALPMLQSIWLQSRQGQPPGDLTPRERLMKIWHARQLSDESLEAFLEQIYHERMAELIDQARASASAPLPPDATHRTVLVELFTGTECPPCVAADLATAALRETYSPSQVIVLQYHQHIPGPDPLCNQDAEDRFVYYEGQGTPTVIVDGVDAPAAGGVLQHVARVYGALREAVDRRLTVPSAITISASAETIDDVIHVKASVSGLREDQLDKVRLRLALVEDSVKYTASNGVREHHGVVRELLGGARGTGAKAGQLNYSVSLPRAELKQHLVDYLTQFEIGRNVNFAEKPLVLQPLSLVAWVQDDSTREVLQALSIPIQGASQASDELVPSAATPANQSPNP